MLSITTIVILALAGLLALFLLIGFLVGAKRGLAKQALALGLILVAVPLSIVVARIVATLASEYAWPHVIAAIPAEYLSALEASPSLMAFVEALPAALVAPLIFGVVYFTLLLFLKIVYAIVGHMKSFRKESFANRAVSTWTGAALGALAAAVLFVCIMMPAVGYLNVASTALNALTDEDSDAPVVLLLPALNGTLSAGGEIVVEGEESDGDDGALAMLAEINSAYVKPLAESPVIAGVGAVGGNLMFRTLSSSRINDVEVDVLGELVGVAETVVKLEPMLGVEVKDFGTEQTDAVRAVVDDIDDSDILKNIFSEVLSHVAITWLEGDTFLGIPSPVNEETSPMIKPVMEELISLLATSNADNIAGDLYTIADVFDTLVENDILALMGGEMTTDSLIYTLSSDGMLAEVLVAFKSNEHMESLIPVVINMGMEAIGSMLGMPEDDAAVYESLMTEVTDSVNGLLAKEPDEITAEEISTALQDTAAKYGITFSDSLADFYGQSIVNDFTPGETYTEEEVVGYFAEIAAYLATTGEENAPLDGELTDEDGLTNLGMIRLDSNKTGGKSRVKFTPPAKAPVIEETEKNTTAMLSGEVALEHSLVTKEALKMDKNVIKEMSAEQIKNDGEKITETLVVLTDILAVLQPEEEPAEPEEDEDLEDDVPEVEPEEPKPEESKPGLGLGTIAALNEAGLGAALGNLGTTNLLKNAAPQLVVGALQAGGVVLPKAETEEIIEIIKKDNEANANKPAEQDCSKGHKFGRWELVSEPTCTEMGVEEHTCKVCGLKATRSINAKGHSLTGWTVETEAACAVEGVSVRSCQRCDYKVTKPIAAKGHVASAWIIDTDASYDTEGKKHKECLTCGTLLETSIVPQLSHAYVSEVVAPTCTEQGCTTHVCSDCGHSYTDDYVPAVSHEFSKWSVTTPATCTEDGISERACTVCAFTETKTVKATGHKYATAYTTDVAPTATTVGSKSRHCKGCDEKIDVTEIPATGDATVLESLVNSTADLMNVIDHIQQGNLTEEELIADIEKVFAGLNASTAKIVGNVIQPSLIQQYVSGMSAANATNCANLIREVVMNIATADVDDYSKESALMSDLLHMVLKAKDSDATRLFTDADGVAGKMNVTARVFMEKVLGSEIISIAINSANLGTDPFHVSESLQDADVADFIAAANALFAEGTTHHGNAQRVLDFANLVGLELSYNATTHIFTQVVAE